MERHATVLMLVYTPLACTTVFSSTSPIRMIVLSDVKSAHLETVECEPSISNQTVICACIGFLYCILLILELGRGFVLFLDISPRLPQLIQLVTSESNFSKF